MINAVCQGYMFMITRIIVSVTSTSTHNGHEIGPSEGALLPIPISKKEKEEAKPNKAASSDGTIDGV